MFIQKVNIFLLSLFVALSPTAAFAIAPAMGVSALLPMQGAVEAMMADLAAQGSAVAAASMEVGTSAAALGASAAALAAAGAAGYGVGTAANSAFGISDAVASALAGEGLSINNGVILKDITPASHIPDNGRFNYYGECSVMSTCTTSTSTDINSFVQNALAGSNRIATYGAPWTLANLIGDGNPYSDIRLRAKDGSLGSVSMRIYQLPVPRPPDTPQTRPATNDEIGHAIAGSPAATATTAASTAMAAAAAAAPDIGNCSKLGGTYNLNSGLCVPARDKNTGQPLTGLESAEHAAAMAALANSTANSKTKTDAAIAMSQAYDAALADALANPTDQTKQDKLAAAIKDLGIANANATTANTSATADATKASATATPATQFPVFCTWAIVVCDGVSAVKDAIKWTKQEPVAPTNTLATVETTMPSQVQSVNLDQNYINFGNQCPADIPINFSIMGTSVNLSISYSHFCQFLSMLKPFVLATAFIGAIYIVSGSNRPIGDS